MAAAYGRRERERVLLKFAHSCFQLWRSPNLSPALCTATWLSDATHHNVGLRHRAKKCPGHARHHLHPRVCADSIFWLDGFWEDFYTTHAILFRFSRNRFHIFFVGR